MQTNPMKKTVALVWLLAAASQALAQPVRPADPALAPEGASVHRDLAYVPGGHERQKLDLYLPKDGAKQPLILHIHGGAFRMGSKADGVPVGYLAQGYAVASINYRLSQHATFPAQIEDCKAAVRWLRAHAGEYRLDPDRFAAWGPSAGGHLAALLGTTGDVAEFDVGANLDQSSRVQAVVDYFGPTDFLQMDAHRLPQGQLHDPAGSPESLLIGGPIQENKQRTARANPIAYVTAGDPPFLICHGDADPLVPHHQSELLETALRKAGVPVIFHTVEGGGHGRFQDPKVPALTQEFLATHLKAAAGDGVESRAMAGATAGSEGVDASTGGGNVTAADPIAFFQHHFFPFEPFYFIAGTESPNARFQISLRYQLFTGEGWVADQWSGLTNLSVAYTQTSLWDWKGPSAPFFDSSYKPEVNYTWLHVDGGHLVDWIRLDLQGGVQHESNGRDGAESRSLNIVYLRPTLTFGRAGGFQVSVAPKAFLYLGDMDENPDLADYRGHVEVRAVLGWSDNVQLAATTRVGDGWRRGSLQCDLTYPMWKLPVLRSSVFVHAQYFVGYGESLLRYDERGDSLRAGFALFR